MNPTTTPSWSEQKSPSPTSATSPIFHVFGDRPFQADGDLLALAFAPEGGLWSVEEPGVLRHWNPGTGIQLAWHPLSDLETLWVFSPDARRLASGSDDLTLWDVASGQVEAVLPQSSWVTALAFGGGGNRAATGHDNGLVRIWDLSEHRLLCEIPAHAKPVSALMFSPDSGRLASAGEDKLIRLWDAADGREVGRLEGHTDRIPALAWHPDGVRLISAGWDTTARVWDVRTCQPLILLNSHAAQVTALALNADGSLLACADSSHALHIWDAVAQRLRYVVRGHCGEVRCLAFSADGRCLASGGGDRVIHLWSEIEGQKWRVEEGDPPGRTIFRPSLRGPHVASRTVRPCVAISPDGARLASVGGGSNLLLWNTASARGCNEGLAQPTGHSVLHTVAFSPDGRWLATGGADAHIHLWDASGGRKRASLEGPAPPITSLAFSPDSEVLASGGSQGTDVWLWNVDSGEPLLLIPDAADACAVEVLAFAPQGRLLAVGGIDWLSTSGLDGAISVWDVTRSLEIALLSGGTTSVAFHPSGRLLASASLVQTVRLWDVADRRLVAELAGHEDAVTCVAYSPDGRLLASGSDDHSVRLWDADTGALLGLTELDTQVKTLCFSPDGRFLFTGNANLGCYQLAVEQVLGEQ